MTFVVVCYHVKKRELEVCIKFLKFRLLLLNNVNECINSEDSKVRKGYKVLRKIGKERQTSRRKSLRESRQVDIT